MFGVDRTVFWMLAQIAQVVVPEYYAPALEGVQADGEVLQLDTDRPLGTGFYLYRMAPGTTTQAYSHSGHEEFLMLEGDFVDHDGTRYGPGDLVWLRDSTSHVSYIESGCLIVVFAADFGPPDN